MKSVLALAAAATALAAAAAAVAEEITGSTPNTGTPETPDETPTRGRGRPKKEDKEPEISDDDRYESNKKLIEPLVKDGKGDEVKAVIKKYADSLKNLPADKQKAFEKDLDALNF